MKSIRLQNFRCLKDTGHIEIKPLTIIVGENSSGKSTFSRTFPLLRQSFSDRARGPILLYGELVDFGELKNIITNDEEDESLIISFNFDIHRGREKKIEDATASISIKDQGNNTPYISSYKFKFNEHEIEIKITKNEIKNFYSKGEDFGKYFSNVITIDDGRLVPILMEKNERSSFFIKQQISVMGWWGRKYFSDFHLPQKLEEELVNILSKYHKKNTSPKTIEKLKDNLIESIISQKEDFISLIPSLGVTQKWKQETTEFSSDQDVRSDLERIEKIIAISAALQQSEYVDHIIRETSSQVRYIAPLRATAERFYRKRNIAVSEIDFRGENLAMYLASLTDTEFDKLKKWLSENFSLQIVVGKSAGHIHLEIRHKESKFKYNMADMGFGFSQVMPILVQLWSLIDNTDRPKFFVKIPYIYVIEQPELHLHPRLQAALASVFCEALKMAKTNKIDLRIVIETHSESIINKIGIDIANKKFKSEDTNVVIFDKRPEENITEVHTAHYNNEGQLKNWPWGFFD